MKYWMFILILGGMLLVGCSKNEDFIQSDIFYTDTIPAEIIHDVIFNSSDDMWILGSSFDSDADLPAYSSVLPYKMQLIKKENNRYLLYDRIPTTILVRFDHADHLLLLGNNSLRIFNQGRIDTYAGPDLPENASFTSMVIDQNNQIWVAGLHTGLQKFDGMNWESYTSENSVLPDNNIYTLASNGESVWALLYNQNGVVEIKNNQLKFHPLPEEASTNQNIYYIEAGKNGNLWLTSQNKVFLIDDSKNNDISDLNHYLRNTIGAISVRKVKADNEGNLFILYTLTNTSQERNIIKITPDLTLENITIPNDIRNNTIYALSFDSNNDLWIASPKGIFKIDE